MSTISKIPEKLREKFNGLKMAPADWTTMWNAFGSEESYREVVMDYQNRERETLPKCKTWFGVCIYYDHGRCGCKEFCRFKVK